MQPLEVRKEDRAKRRLEETETAFTNGEISEEQAKAALESIDTNPVVTDGPSSDEIEKKVAGWGGENPDADKKETKTEKK